MSPIVPKSVPKLKPGDLVKFIGQEINEEYGPGIILAVDTHTVEYKIYWIQKQHVSWENARWADYSGPDVLGATLAIEKLS